MYDTKMSKHIDAIALQIFEKSIKSNAESLVFTLLTNKEKITIGRRIIIAQGIIEGKTRFEINEYLKVSPNTFAQINRWLESELTEYDSAYQKPTSSRKEKSRYAQPFSYGHLKRNFPMHFILFTHAEKLLKKK
jgi:hypothetical protein